ncbi:MAG: hypothetical protein IMZ43_05565 [Thermoplasmata archaeon]|nr:hypothetical protein [Thermoplasmata archaeon]
MRNIKLIKSLTVSICAVVLLVLGSLTNVVGYQSVKSTPQPDSTLCAVDTYERYPQSGISYSPVEWDRVFGDQSSYGFSVYEDSDGDSVLTGRINHDIVLIKTDINGNMVWNRSFDSGLNDWGCCVRQTMDGGYIVTGAVDSYHDMFTFSHVGLLKYDHQGNLLWNRSMKFGGYSDGRYVLQTSDQGFLVLGSTSIQYSVLLIKTDAMGHEQWNRTFGSAKSDYGISLAHAADDGYDILVQSIYYYPYNTTFWLIHIDENGSELWNRTIPTVDRWISSMNPTDDGGYILVGEYYYSKTSSSDAWLMKINANGYEEWNRTYGGPLCDSGSSVRQTPDGGYVFTGYTGSIHWYDPYTLWVVKTDAAGIEQWNRSILSNLSGYGSVVIFTSDGMFIIVGSFDSKIWILKLANEPPHMKRRVFLFGSITHLETEGVFLTFQAHNILLVQFFPIKINHYIGNEYVTISQNYTGILRPKFIACLCRM